MSNRETGGPAFPTKNYQSTVPLATGYAEGMTLRDYFAAKAMQLAQLNGEIAAELKGEVLALRDRVAELEQMLAAQPKQFVEGQYAKPSRVYDITGAEPPPADSGFAKLGEFE